MTGPGNRLLSDGTYNYEYDDEGNTAKRTRITGARPDGSTVREFRWDHRNRLVAVIDKLPGGTATQEVRFSYDALDRRISKSVDKTPLDAVDAAFTHFVYDREDVTLDFVDPDGAGPEPLVLDQWYLHGPGIDQVLAQDSAAGTVHWHLTDHLGTVKDLADNAGGVANHIVYDSYGNVESQSSSSVDSRYSFTGREYDDEIALSFYRRRYYESRSGQFLSDDPRQFSTDETNLKRYAMNAPNIYSDPFGEDATNYQWLGVHPIVEVNTLEGTYWIQFGPELNPFWGTGKVLITHAEDVPWYYVPTRHIDLTLEEGQRILERAREIQKYAADGNYKYSLFDLLWPGNWIYDNLYRNCVGFRTDLFSD